MKVIADFNRITGKIKPMHGVGQAPIIGTKSSPFDYLGEAGIPYSRLHDVGGFFGGFRFVDIPNIFRDFDADETLPESYDFTFTDWLITKLMEQKCEPFFRLGVTIENDYEMKAYRIFPPKDFEKWARICEHIIRHYNEGWADGFHYNITYWEIWNEPDNEMMWLGTAEEYYRLYEVTSKHLKKCFGDSIRVGGYASCGFSQWLKDPNCEGIPDAIPDTKEYWIEFAHGFLRYISSDEHKSPLDFFSWHSYGQVYKAIEKSKYCRRMLEKYGFDDVEEIINEWNPTPDKILRSTPMAAARALAMMLGLQKTRVDQMEYYDARIGASVYGGMFNPDTWEPYLTYYAFKSFNEAYKLQNEVLTETDDEHVFVGGATNGEKAVLLLANLHEEPVEAEFELNGVSMENLEILMIDSAHSYVQAEKKIQNGKLILPEHSCIEIRFQ